MRDTAMERLRLRTKQLEEILSSKSILCPLSLSPIILTIYYTSLTKSYSSYCKESCLHLSLMFAFYDDVERR